MPPVATASKRLISASHRSAGILDQTYYAYNMIEAIQAKLITWNTGNIQSAANLLFLAGDERYATDGSTFFFHQTGYDPPPGRPNHEVAIGAPEGGAV